MGKLNLKELPTTDPITPLNQETMTLLRTFTYWSLPSRSINRRIWPLALGVSYLLLIYILGGIKADHILIGSLVLLDYYNEKSRLFLKCFLPFILTGIVYDSMRYFYWQAISGHIHVEGPYYRDLAWFGISIVQDNGTPHLLTPNEYLAIHTSKTLDLLCGFAYLIFIGEYLLTAFYLFIRHKLTCLRHFGWSFFIVNLGGFITYFIYPAAPPWYVTQYGLGPARMDIFPIAAGAQRFDIILGTHFFDQIYGRGVDVFGAYPSLHVAYPLLTALVTFQIRELRLFRAPAILFFILMCFSAVYLQHHYMVDILLGILYAVIAWLVTAKVNGTEKAKNKNDTAKTRTRNRSNWIHRSQSREAPTKPRL